MSYRVLTSGVQALEKYAKVAYIGQRRKRLYRELRTKDTDCGKRQSEVSILSGRVLISDVCGIRVKSGDLPK